MLKSYQKVASFALILRSFASIEPASGGSTHRVWAVTGGRAELPCRPDPKVPNDLPVLVLWYRSSNTLPIYSYDARDGDFTSGVRWTDEEALGGRAYFEGTTLPPMLVLDPTRVHDEGIYTCRIDYRVSSSTTSIVSLTVIIPPGPPLILWEGREATDYVGPLREGERAELTCRSVGGNPPPVLTWRSNGIELPRVEVALHLEPVTGAYAAESTVHISVTRELLGKIFTCLAQTPLDIRTVSDHYILITDEKSQNMLLKPRTVSVTLNITLAPTDVRILGSESIVVTTGSIIKKVCRAFGSQPPAQITWSMNSQSLERFVTQVIEADGSSTGTLIMNVTEKNDRSRLTCEAVNPQMTHEPIYDVTQLIVYYPPEVRLSLGPLLNEETIKEGDDVYFECDIEANPRFNRIEWFHNGAVLLHDPRSGLVISGQSLVLRGLQRSHSGSYNCAATNLQGRTSSNAVLLTVRHAPICAGSTQERTQGATRGSPVTVKCTVEAEPAQDLTWIWVKIREDSTDEELIEGDIKSLGLTSSVALVPLKQEDYGRILCRATNSVGTQRVACIINLVPAGPPDPPSNCTATTSDPEVSVSGHEVSLEVLPEAVLEVSLSVTCLEGFDGGLPQYFQLEAWQDDDAIANISSEFPEWVIDGVRTGVGIKLNIMAHNARGSSHVVSMEVHTTSAQQHAAPGRDSSTDIAPLLGALAGGLCVLLILIIVAVFMARKKRPEKSKTITEVSIPSPTSVTAEGYDPDVVQSIQRIPPSLDVLPLPQGQKHTLRVSRQSSSEDTERCVYLEGNGRRDGGQTTVSCKLKAQGHNSFALKDANECQCSGIDERRRGDDENITCEEESDDQYSEPEGYESSPCLRGKHLHEYRLLPTRDSQLSSSASASVSSENLYLESSARTFERHSPPSVYTEQQISSTQETQRCLSFNCKKATSLPRSKRRRMRQHNARASQTHQRLPTSASTGQLTALSTVQKEALYSDSTTKLYGPHRSDNSVLRNTGSRRRLTRSAQVIAESDIDMEFTIPIDKNCSGISKVMIMKLPKDFHQIKEPPSCKFIRHRSSSQEGSRGNSTPDKSLHFKLLSTASSSRESSVSHNNLYSQELTDTDSVNTSETVNNIRGSNATEAFQVNNHNEHRNLRTDAKQSNIKCPLYNHVQVLSSEKEHLAKNVATANKKTGNINFSTFHKESTV